MREISGVEILRPHSAMKKTYVDKRRSIGRRPALPSAGNHIQNVSLTFLLYFSFVRFVVIVSDKENMTYIYRHKNIDLFSFSFEAFFSGHQVSMSQDVFIFS
ncbi:hypothetical protein BT93_E1099 [Corymbia citriodora subsp. variegata]|nr:hypothetical protein BT93_E1099 [Corymbia citriodora subsp. variegata]